MKFPLVRTEGQARALQRAIERAGGPTALARGLLGPGATPMELKGMATLVRRWRDMGACPPRWVGKVSKLTKVSRYSLAPDVFDRGD